MNCKAIISTKNVLTEKDYIVGIYEIDDDWRKGFKDFYRLIMHEARDLTNEVKCLVKVKFVGDVCFHLYVFPGIVRFSDGKGKLIYQYWRGIDAD